MHTSTHPFVYNNIINNVKKLCNLSYEFSSMYKDLFIKNSGLKTTLFNIVCSTKKVKNNVINLIFYIHAAIYLVYVYVFEIILDLVPMIARWNEW